MNNISIILFVVVALFFVPGNFAENNNFSPNEATSILKLFYHWLTPEKNESLAHQQPISWADGLSGWEKVDQAHCAVFEEFARKKSSNMEEAASLLNENTTSKYGQQVQEFIGKLLKNIQEKIDAKIKEKAFKKDQALLVMFREVFSIGKQLVGKVLDAHSEWQKKEDNEMKKKQRREFAFHKYMQLELFFTKCALHMHEIRNGRPQLVLQLSYPNENQLFSEPYFDEQISVQWHQQDADSDDLLIREPLSVDNAAAMVAFLRQFINNLCSKSFTAGGITTKFTGWFGKKTAIQQPVATEVPDIDSLYDCANKNGVQFAKLFDLFTEEVLEQHKSKGQQPHLVSSIELSSLTQELLLYELHRIRQRLEDIGKQSELTEQKKIRALLAAMAKFGAEIVEDLLAKAAVNQLKVTRIISTKSSFLLDKYHYKDMAEWFEAVHKKMKRHIKYHVNAIVYAPNGIRVQPLRTPTIDSGHLNTIDESKFLKKIALTSDVQLIAKLIEYGQISLGMKNGSVENGGENQQLLCGEVEKMQTFEKELNIVQAVKGLLMLVKGTSNDGGLLAREVGLQCKVELTVIYGAAIEYASEFKSSWHRKAEEELHMIVERIWGLHLAESSVAKALSAHECTASLDGRKAVEFHRKAGKIVKFYYEEEMKKKKEEEEKEKVEEEHRQQQQEQQHHQEHLLLLGGNGNNNSRVPENGGNGCKFSMNPLENVQKTLEKLKANLKVAKKMNVFLFNGKTGWLDSVIDKLSEKFEKLEKLHESLQRVLSAHIENPRKIKQSDVELIREAVHFQNAELKLLRQYALEEIRKAELDVQFGASEKKNVIEFGTNNASAVVQLEHFKVASYDQEGKPSSGQHILFPGELRFMSGSLRMTKQIEHSFLATAKFSLEICLPLLPCIHVCNNGEHGKRLIKTVEGFLGSLSAKKKSSETVNKGEDRAATEEGKKETEDILAMIVKYEAELKCTTQFLFHKEIFDLPAVAFTERFFHDILAADIRSKEMEAAAVSTNNVENTKTKEMKNKDIINLDATVAMAGMMEPEEGFFELPSLLSKNIFKMLPYLNNVPGLNWISKKAKLKFGIEVTETAKEQELTEVKGEIMGNEGGKAPLLFGGKPIVSLKLPATNDYLEVKLI